MKNRDNDHRTMQNTVWRLAPDDCLPLKPHRKRRKGKTRRTIRESKALSSKKKHSKTAVFEINVVPIHDTGYEARYGALRVSAPTTAYMETQTPAPYR